MEPSYQTRKIIGRWLALLTLVLLGASFWAHYRSVVVRQLAAREDTPIQVVIFTEPAMLFSYNPATHKTQITVASTKCSAQGQKSCFNETYYMFFVPQQTQQQLYWTQFKENLTQWRFKLVIVWNYLRAYVNGLVQKRTNIYPSEFILLSKELITLTSTDFAIEYPASAKKKKHTPKIEEKPVDINQKPEVILPASMHEEEKPLVVEILNASGKKGLALAVTQYLREQNAKGLLRIDVLQYDNYPKQEDKSFVVDYSGKLVQVTQASRMLGISEEIRSEKSTTAICDTRIVLGKDFSLPL